PASVLASLRAATGETPRHRMRLVQGGAGITPTAEVVLACRIRPIPGRHIVLGRAKSSRTREGRHSDRKVEELLGARFPDPKSGLDSAPPSTAQIMSEGAKRPRGRGECPAHFRCRK